LNFETGSKGGSLAHPARSASSSMNINFFIDITFSLSADSAEWKDDGLICVNWRNLRREHLGSEKIAPKEGPTHEVRTFSTATTARAIYHNRLSIVNDCFMQYRGKGNLCRNNPAGAQIDAHGNTIGVTRNLRPDDTAGRIISCDSKITA
jgi:hypothetical protein